MLEIFLKTLPFFALIALGFQACRTGFFTAEAAAYLTKFVFYFALSAMLFRFAANLSLAEIFDWWFVAAYLWGCFVVYLLATGVAMLRGRPVAEAAVEAQCAVIGNTGFLGVPMLVVLMGEAAAGPVLMVLAIDLVVFSSLIVILVTGSREGRVRISTLRNVGLGLLKNPMIMSILLGLGWSATGWDVPGPVNEFLAILGAAATPGALFAIGASLAGKSAERLSVAGWLSFCKLVLHPAAVALAALVLFPVDTFSAAVMIAAASLPVAGNVYILAQHYGVAPQRVSASILISTAVSVLTVSAVIAWVAGIAGIGVGP
ncbi:AEC family transporter [Roseibacterium sp. SDUM158017]|uniref:AEC family transporter n=1 Tax=Roseicyclus salinarum TaxID=3036773 RepID=UPI002414DA0C|nr:AEC family transporter [Roseibacterium sp. SDUM158017]MDG4646895.1 AEC family transporter [Roseibacterium sp. SDUM158017]